MVFIRNAGLADAELLCKMGAETFYETYASMNSPENMELYTDSHFKLQTIQRELNDAQTHFFLAFIDEDPAGYIQMNFKNQREEFANKKQMEIERLYVYNVYKRQKIGYQLIKSGIDIAKSAACEIVWLGVWEHNNNAILFYEKAGFSSFGRHIFQLGNDAQNDLLMRIDI